MYSTFARLLEIFVTACNLISEYPTPMMVYTFTFTNKFIFIFIFLEKGKHGHQMIAK